MNEIMGKESITSLELLEQINIFREQEDRSKLQHKDLLKVIRNEFEEEIGEGKISPSSYINSQNKEQPMFILTLPQAKQVLVRESKFVRKAVIHYIETLENKVKEQRHQLDIRANLLLSIYNGGQEGILASKQLVELETTHLLETIEEQKPDVDFAKAIKVSDTNLSIGNFAKQTTLGRNELFKFLRENKILFYNDGNNVPYQKYIKQGYFKCTQVVTNNHINVITKVTPKGQEWLFKKFPQLKRKE